MSYQVKDYMTRDVNTIDCELSVTEATKTMASDDNYEGYVIILKKGKPIGFLTERDIINKVVANELDPSKINVCEVMSSPLRTIDPDEDLLKASQLMAEHNVRKLVVIRDEIIYGVITAKTIAQQCSNYVDRSVRDIIRWTGSISI